jgi:uroporphyrinogen-III synthase
MRLIVTRPRAQAQGWVATLCAAGVDAAALPLIEIAPVQDAEPLHEAWRQMGQWQFVMFVSATAVERFFAAGPATMAWPQVVRVGATGPGTVRALRQAGVPEANIDAPSEDAPRWDSEALWQRLVGRPWAGRRVLVVRGQDGRDWLSEQWAAQGAQLDFIAAYRRLPPAWTPEEQVLWQELLDAPDQALWHFSASEGVRHLAARHAAWPRSSALAIHERVLAAASALGFATLRQIAPTPAAAAQAWREAQVAAGCSVQSKAP